jgi:D-arabinose 1-dehydrogenase-like Zn-dependent alcohol dehydrogenase
MKKIIANKLSLQKHKQDSSSQTSSRKASEAVPEETKQQTATITESKSMAPADLPKTYKAAVIVGQQKPLEIQELPMQEVKDGEILVKVKACGVCHSDHHVLNGDMGPPYVLLSPLRRSMANIRDRAIKCLGHEFIGDVVAVPSSEKKWKVGDRVGGAWHGGHDGSCRPCNRGQFQMCHNKTINGVFREGGYGEYATLRTEAAVRIPKDADPAKAAPLLCAGTFGLAGSPWHDIH